MGSKHDPATNTGLAHYLEHLMFKGTDVLEPGEFSSVVAANGGSDGLRCNILTPQAMSRMDRKARPSLACVLEIPHCLRSPLRAQSA